MNPKLLAACGIIILVAAIFLMSGRQSAPETSTIRLYFYNEARDTSGGNIMCSPDSVTAVERIVPQASSTIEHAVRLLIREKPREDERSRGLASEFPLRGFALERLTSVDGVVTLIFSDPQNASSGGSCRVGILRGQIEATVRQFPDVREVRILPDDILQP